nr:expansin-like A1 [Tanacetum cinerariifolium]
MAIFFYSIFTLSLIASASACDRCLHQTKAVLFTNASALSYGACGYGSSATSFYNGHLAAAVPSIFKLGSGCGACFQNFSSKRMTFSLLQPGTESGVFHGCPRHLWIFSM